MIATRWTTVALMAALLTAMTQSATATLVHVIYHETFSGTGAELLNGKPVSGGTGAGTLWSANSFINADGTITGVQDGSAILPVDLQSGNLYQLEFDVTFGAADNKWIGVSLTQDATLASPGAQNSSDRMSGNNSRGFMLFRDGGANPVTDDVQIFKQNTSNQVDVLDYEISAGTNYTVRVTYDVTTSLGGALATYEISDNLAVGGDGVAGFVTLASNVDLFLSSVVNVGFTFDNSSSVPPIVDNFIFSTTAPSPVPEPSSIVCCALALGGVALARRRRRPSRV